MYVYIYVYGTHDTLTLTKGTNSSVDQCTHGNTGHSQIKSSLNIGIESQRYCVLCYTHLLDVDGMVSCNGVTFEPETANTIPWSNLFSKDQ